MSRKDVIESIARERERQIEIWGDRTNPGDGHTGAEWVTILSEEVGELAEAVLNYHFSGEYNENIYDEAIQVAAVSVAIAESYLKGGITVDKDEDKLRPDNPPKPSDPKDFDVA